MSGRLCMEANCLYPPARICAGCRWNELALLPAELLTRMRRPTIRPLILVWLGQWLHEQRRAGHLQPVLAAKMEDALSGLNQVQGGCGAHCQQPDSVAYTVILYRTVGVYCLLLPFGLGGRLGWMTAGDGVCFVHPFCPGNPAQRNRRTLWQRRGTTCRWTRCPSPSAHPARNAGQTIARHAAAKGLC